MKKLKSIFNKNKEKGIKSTFSLKREQGDIEVNSNISDQDSLIIVSSEEISLIEEEIQEEVTADESDKNEKEDNQVEKLNCAQ